MTTSIPDVKAPGPWLDEQSSSETSALELGFASFSIGGPPSVKGEESTRLPALSVSSVSTVGDGSTSSSSVKQYHQPSTPPSHTQSIGGNLGGAVSKSLLGGPATSFGRSASDPMAPLPSPIGRSSNRNTVNSSQCFSGSPSAEVADLFLRSGGDRVTSVRQSLSFLIGVSEKENEDGCIEPDKEQSVAIHSSKDGPDLSKTCSREDSSALDSIGLCLSPGDGRTLQAMGRNASAVGVEPSLVKREAATGQANSSFDGLFYGGSFEEDIAGGGHAVESPHRSSMRLRAFSSPGPVESSRIGCIGGSAGGHFGPSSPSAASFSHVWDECRGRYDPLTGTNLHFRNFTSEQIPELSSTDDEGLPATGFFGGMRRGLSSESDQYQPRMTTRGKTGQPQQEPPPSVVEQFRGSIYDNFGNNEVANVDLWQKRHDPSGSTGGEVSNFGLECEGGLASSSDDQHCNNPTFDSNSFSGSPRGVGNQGSSGLICYAKSYDQDLSVSQRNHTSESSYESRIASLNAPRLIDSPRTIDGPNLGSGVYPQLRHALSDVSSNRDNSSMGANGMGMTNAAMMDVNNFNNPAVRGRSFTDGNVGTDQFQYYMPLRSGRGPLQASRPEGTGITAGIRNVSSEETSFRSTGSLGDGRPGPQNFQVQPNLNEAENDYSAQELRFHAQQQMQMYMSMQGPPNNYQMQQQEQQLHLQAQPLRTMQQLHGTPMAPFNDCNPDLHQQPDGQQMQQLQQIQQQQQCLEHGQDYGGVQQQRQLFLQGEGVSNQGPPTRVFIPGMGTLIMSTTAGPGGETYGRLSRSLSGPSIMESQHTASLDSSPHNTFPSRIQHIDGFSRDGSQSNLNHAALVQVHQGVQSMKPQHDGAVAVPGGDMINGNEISHCLAGSMTPSRSDSAGNHQAHIENGILASPESSRNDQLIDASTTIQCSSANSSCNSSAIIVDGLGGMRRHSFDQMEKSDDSYPGLNVQPEVAIGVHPTNLFHGRTVVSNASLSSSSSMEQIVLPHYGSADSSAGCGSTSSSVIPRLVYNVKFKRTQRSFILGPRAPRDLKVGCYVKVEADRGEDLGIVVSRVPAEKFNVTSRSSYRLSSSVAESGGGGAADLKKIIRLATHDEISLLVDKREEEENLLKVCRAKVKQRGLTMNVVDAEYQFDRHKLIFFFEAEGRIDFRELVRDLFSIYKTRIWMQQLDKGGSHSCGGSVGGGNSVSGSSDAADASTSE